MGKSLPPPFLKLKKKCNFGGWINLYILYSSVTIFLNHTAYSFSLVSSTFARCNNDSEKTGRS